MDGAEHFFALHAGLPKQGPGSDASTARALALCAAAPGWPARHPARAVDMGCGPGRQTVELARLTGGTVHALDLHGPFLEELAARAEAAGVGAQVLPAEASMLGWEPPDGPLDLVWCESAVYSVGFDAALADWRRLLVPGGCLAVSELSWLEDEGPGAPPADEEARAWWQAAYPALRADAANRAALADAGFELLGSFPLPVEDWTDGYYDELAARVARFRGEWTDPAALAVLDESEEEQAMFRRASPGMAYVFYVARRPLT